MLRQTRYTHSYELDRLLNKLKNYFHKYEGIFSFFFVIHMPPGWRTNALTGNMRFNLERELHNDGKQWNADVTSSLQLCIRLFPGGHRIGLEWLCAPCANGPNNRYNVRPWKYERECVQWETSTEANVKWSKMTFVQFCYNIKEKNKLFDIPNDTIFPLII